jgi:hypothetical protein
MTLLVLVLSELIHGPTSVLCNLEVHSGPLDYKVDNINRAHDTVSSYMY